MIEQAKINEIVKRIVDNFMPERVILFGSYAEGTPKEDSDLDILVVKDTEMPRHKRSMEVRKYLRGMKVPIDLVVYTPDEIEEWKEVDASFISQVMAKGRILYGKEI